ncbi:MAG: hypothetical protein SFU83_23640 [Meiothermus sp.]|nr:hypothetical protein [Meiothermus sp.]
MSLQRVIRGLFAEAQRTGKRAHQRLNSGLHLRAGIVVKEGRTFEVLHLTRPDHPKGPSTTEAHTCAKHAGWGERYGFRADPQSQTISIWREVKARRGGDRAAAV